MPVSLIVQVVTRVLSILTIFSQLFLILFIILLILNLRYKRKLAGVFDWFGKNSMTLAFVVALAATLSSLFFSEIAKYEPCKFCWLQRIFMYPLVLLLGIALWKKDYGVSKYIIPMSFIGAFLAGYQYVVSVFTKASAEGFCPATGPSCLIKYFSEFGYITIPMMSLTAFVLIALMAFYWHKTRRDS